MNYDQMMKFCNPDDARFFCRQPFPDMKGNVLATDGKVIVSVPANFATEEIQVYQKAIDIFAKYLDPELFQTGFVPLKVEIPPYPPCAPCNGTGKVNEERETECPDCDGEGGHYIGRHYYECIECDGSGKVADQSKTDVKKIDCEKCGGTGRGFHPVKLDARSFQSKYLELIMELPNAEYLPDGDKHAIMRFKFDGGIGCLMPMMI